MSRKKGRGRRTRRARLAAVERRENSIFADPTPETLRKARERTTALASDPDGVRRREGTIAYMLRRDLITGDQAWAADRIELAWRLVARDVSSPGMRLGENTRCSGSTSAAELSDGQADLVAHYHRWCSEMDRRARAVMRSLDKRRWQVSDIVDIVVHGVTIRKLADRAGVRRSVLSAELCAALSLWDEI
ncbi:MAG: hypothetical protein Alpg2KO_00390 [Alphaproteobacteria bacterium]